MRPKRKRQAPENPEPEQQILKDKAAKRRKIEDEEKGEASNQAKRPCLDDAPLVPNRVKAQKRKRDKSCEPAPKKKRDESCEPAPKKKRDESCEPAPKKKRDESSKPAPKKKRDESSEPAPKKKRKTDMRDNFIFHKVLGRGAHAKVLLATHKKTKTKVAVKVASKIYRGPEHPKIERNILELLNESPFFTHLHQSFQSKEHLFYVLEYIRGGDLLELLKTKKYLDTEIVRLYAAELACAISYMHSKRVIHRDLKPSNILIGTDGHLKLADFGTSVILPENFSKMKGIAGTIAYMAPEVLSGKRYNLSADWFSYGATVFKMAAGFVPFYAETFHAMKRNILTCNTFYPRSMDRDLKDLLENLLIMDPTKRLGADNIRSHPFFRNINWADVEQRRLVVPVYGNSEEEATTTETINVRDMFPQKDKYCITPEKDKIFEGFSFVSSSWRPSCNISRGNVGEKGRGLRNRVLKKKKKKTTP